MPKQSLCRFATLERRFGNSIYPSILFHKPSEFETDVEINKYRLKLSNKVFKDFSLKPKESEIVASSAISL
jgi:hypothetical protein